MEFLSKLYESNFFGIGLFAVISVLVVTFLIVLFFGKKDEKKRKMEEENVSTTDTNTGVDAFKEMTPIAPLDISASTNVPLTPVAPINNNVSIDTPVPPVAPINPIEPMSFGDIAPIEPKVNVNPAASAPAIDPVVPIINEPTPSEPIIPNVPNPNLNGPIGPINPTPIINETQAPSPIINEPINPIPEPPIPEVKPVEPINFNNPTPKVMEPIKINIPEEPVIPTEPTTPIIEEKVSPILNTEPPINNRPIIEEPVIGETYYRPVENVKNEEVSVPNIDFDALAKSISKELDELEQSTKPSSTYEEVKVTPMSEITAKDTTPRQFSSVYVAPTPTMNNNQVPSLSLIHI